MTDEMNNALQKFNAAARVLKKEMIANGYKTLCSTDKQCLWFICAEMDILDIYQSDMTAEPNQK